MTNNRVLTYPSFAKMLDKLSQTAGLLKHSMSDANTQVAYANFPDYFARIEKYLQIKNISRNDCIAFECQNTTSTLLVLLALFYRGQNFLLLPSEGNSLKEKNFKPDIPVFCKIHMVVDLLSTNVELNPDMLVLLINAQENLTFDPFAFKRLGLTGDNLLMRTSGSTGDAKIVQFSHAHILGKAVSCVQRFGLNSDSRVMIPVPVFHMYGLGAALIPALLSGANINVQANINILRFMEYERHFKPDTVYLNPTLCSMILKRKNNPSFKAISAGAALKKTLSKEVVERFNMFFNLYGSTEMGAVATASIGSALDNYLTHLKPMPGVNIQLDDETKTLYCSDPYCFEGYFDREGYAIAMNVNPYNTGDIAEALPNGCFKVIGRQGDSTNRSGFLVQFSDVENALLETTKVEQTVVLVSQEETVRGQKMFAFCIPLTLTNSFEKTAAVIRKTCFDLLPKYAVPDEVVILKAFPLLPNGKVDRQSLINMTQKNENELIGATQ